MRRGEQAVDKFLISVWIFVGNEVLDFSWRRRETGEVETDAANQSAPIGLGRRRNVFFREPFQNIGVDRCLLRTLNRLKRPMTRLDDRRKFSARIDPQFDFPDLLRSQWRAHGRHHESLLRAAYFFEELARSAVSRGYDARRRRWRIEAQVAHLLRSAVAALAPAFEDRLYVF